MRKIILIFLFLVSLNANEEYSLGDGSEVSSFGLNFGGYISLNYQHTDDIDSFGVDSIGLLGYGDYDKFSYLVELEFKDIYKKTHTNGISDSKSHHTLGFKQLYIDHNFNENYMIKVGKFISPIGFWNLLPINILRDTTSNPISTEILFPQYTTGISGSYTSFNDEGLRVDLIVQNNNDIRHEENNYDVNEHYALGITLEKDDYTFKINGGHLNNLYYALVSGKYEDDNYKFLAELGTQRTKHTTTTPYAGYLQALYKINDLHSAIARVESYDDKLNNNSDDILIVGYTFRPVYSFAFKTEYQLHSKNNKNQFLISLSALF